MDCGRYWLRHLVQQQRRTALFHLIPCQWHWSCATPCTRPRNCSTHRQWTRMPLKHRQHLPQPSRQKQYNCTQEGLGARPTANKPMPHPLARHDTVIFVRATARWDAKSGRKTVSSSRAYLSEGALYSAPRRAGPRDHFLCDAESEGEADTRGWVGTAISKPGTSSRSSDTSRMRCHCERTLRGQRLFLCRNRVALDEGIRSSWVNSLLNCLRL